MHNHNTRETRKRQLFRLWNDFLEHVAFIVVFLIAVYVFFYSPMAASMGFPFGLWG